MQNNVDQVDHFDQLKGIESIREEIRVLKKFSLDPRAEKGVIERTVNHYHPQGIKVVVQEVIQETVSTKILRLAPVEGVLPPFIAGQYINVSMDIDGIKTSRAYSLSSSPKQRAYYEIAVRYKPDGYVTHYMLERMSQGEILEISAPAGQFVYNPVIHGDHIVLIGGGSGITPFMSIVEDQYLDIDSNLKVDLIYGCANANDVIYGKKLQQIADKYEHFNFHLVISEPEDDFQGLTGFISAELIQQVLGTVEGKKFFLCGPEVMYQFVCRELETLGINRQSIKREVQTPPPDPTALAGWPEGIAKDQKFIITLSDGREMEGCASEPLLNTLERNKIYYPAECRAGECSICRAKVVSGEVYIPESMRLRKADRAYNYVHLCAAYPVSDITLQLDY